MKKNKFLKLASALLILCLVTTCAISTTLAKYTTGTSASDTARVAKWGLEVSASGTMFGKYYGANTAGTDAADRITASASGSVDTAASDKVVAPGTKNDTGIKIKIFGQPEVAYQLAATGSVTEEIYLKTGEYGVMVLAYGINAATDFTTEELYTYASNTYTRANSYTAGTTYYRLTDYVNVAEDYYPITWTGTVISTGTEGQPDGDWHQNFETLASAVTALTTGINTVNTNGAFNANEKVNLVYLLTWTWDIQNAQAYADGADTILGNLADSSVATVAKNTAGNYVAVPSANYSLRINCTIGATATQIN